MLAEEDPLHTMNHIMNQIIEHHSMICFTTVELKIFQGIQLKNSLFQGYPTMNLVSTS